MSPVLYYIIALTGAQLVTAIRRERWRKHHELTQASPLPAVTANDQVLDGEKLEFTKEDLHNILCRRFHYYQSLSPALQEKFICRLKDFIDEKLFIIKETKAFKEMPVLVSAAAIQLTFGLKEYRLPFYRYIRIFEEEYLADNEFKILAGNVKGNVISVAWNHVLAGYSNHSDGTNLGLHEMSHALYFQRIIVDEEYAEKFATGYEDLVEKCKLAHQDEVKGLKDFYSSYAESNLQEFWAESVELFFEKPAELHRHYPEVFMAMKLLLNQNPLQPQNPVIRSSLSFEDKMKRIASVISSRLMS